MGLPRFSFLKQLISKSSLRSPKILSEPALNFNFLSPFNRRTYHYRPPPSFDEKLHSKITLFVAGSPSSTVIPFLDKWVQEGNNVREAELQRLVRTLRSKKRFDRALEVSEWMNSKRLDHSFDGDLAVQLDLIGKVHGIDAAEKYFNELDNNSEKIYGALLNCYVAEGLVDKALSHFKKMKDMGLAHNPLTYNGLMTLYKNTDQIEKIPEVLSDMETNGVYPDNFSYRICIKSYGLRSDFTNIEKVLEEMERQPRITMDWRTYITVSSYYMKGGLNEKAVYYLQKAEERVEKDAVGYNNLITMYASLGNVSQLKRLWEKQKTSSRMQINIDYVIMMGSLVKLGAIEEAEGIFQEWESAVRLYDFRVPNVLLIGYTQRGQVAKAEKMLDDIMGKGKMPIPNSWSIIADGHINGGDMKKGLKCMERALEVAPQHQGWEPRPMLVSSILKWLEKDGDIEEVEAFVDLLSRVVSMDQQMYHTLLKANVRHGREIDGILQRMKDDNIDVDEETKKLLSPR